MPGNSFLPVFCPGSFAVLQVLFGCVRGGCFVYPFRARVLNFSGIFMGIWEKLWLSSHSSKGTDVQHFAYSSGDPRDAGRFVAAMLGTSGQGPSFLWNKLNSVGPILWVFTVYFAQQMPPSVAQLLDSKTVHENSCSSCFYPGSWEHSSNSWHPWVTQGRWLIPAPDPPSQGSQLPFHFDK